RGDPGDGVPRGRVTAPRAGQDRGAPGGVHDVHETAPRLRPVPVARGPASARDDAFQDEDADPRRRSTYPPPNSRSPLLRFARLPGSPGPMFFPIPQTTTAGALA